jgi:hypothetical protein
MLRPGSQSEQKQKFLNASWEGQKRASSAFNTAELSSAFNTAGYAPL